MIQRRKIVAGDVFRFRTGADLWGYGQVLLTDIIQYIVVFAPLFPADAPHFEIINSPVLFAGWTTDALIWNGRWEVVDNLSPVSFKFPEYKVGIEGRTWISDVTGQVIRPATRIEAQKLSFKTSNSPIIFQEALEAHHGLKAWKPYFEELTAEVKSMG
jgi:hypothetical protein